MISRLPWKIDESDPSVISDANGDIIAEGYKFFHVDDFEAICKFTHRDWSQDEEVRDGLHSYPKS